MLNAEMIQEVSRFGVELTNLTRTLHEGSKTLELGNSTENYLQCDKSFMLTSRSILLCQTSNATDVKNFLILSIILEFSMCNSTGFQFEIVFKNFRFEFGITQYCFESYRKRRPKRSQ